MEKSESSQAIPVVVVLEQRDIVGKFWVVPSWHLDAVLVGENIAFNENIALNNQNSAASVPHSAAGNAGIVTPPSPLAESTSGSPLTAESLTAEPATHPSSPPPADPVDDDDAMMSVDDVRTATSETGRETRSTRSIWPGYSVHLYKDACERYWHALIGERPLVYVVLREDEVDGSVEPALVTIDYDEATAHAETDDQVLSADIPRELYQRMEAFVLDHYQPADFSKRKRKKWHAQDPRKHR